MLVREVETRNALKAVLEAILPYTKDDEVGRSWLTQAKAALAAYDVKPTAEEDAYRAAAFEEWDGDECDVQDDAVVSIGEDGAYVEAWVFVPKPDTDEDDFDGQCDGGCGRMYDDCASSEGADFCMDKDDYLDADCPESYEAYLKIQGED